MKIKDSIIADNEEALLKQSRSFAVPILKLESRFKMPIIVQYNLCKTIDTIEDSTVLAANEKIEMIEDVCFELKNNRISKNVMQEMLKITPKEESFVFSNYSSIVALFNTLSLNEQQLSTKYIDEMASGMANYIISDIENLSDLNQYCYYVAGTVGMYLSDLLHELNHDMSDELCEELKQDGIHFGLFLQKLNIIRDYRNDSYIRKRHFWPKDYFETDNNLMHILNKMCQESITNDIYPAIRYCQSIPQDSESFDYFIRYILKSSIKYMGMLRGNFMIFFMDKVKLNRVFMNSLYDDIAQQSRQEFLDEMTFEFHELMEAYNS